MKSLFSSILLILLAFWISYSASAQFANVMISDQNWPTEPSIYMNPKNPNQLVAGAVLKAFYYSNDGGYTWGNSVMQSTLGVYGDPCLVIDTAGYIYYFHLSSPVNQPQLWLDRIVCQRSVNNGLSWNDGSSIGKNDPKQQDKEWAVVNPYNNEIYVTWTQFDNYGVADTSKKTLILFSKSSDQGISWSEPVRLSKIPGNCVDSDSTVEGAVPAVGPNGEIYTSWAGPGGIRFDRSLDGGSTWLEEDIFVDPMPGGWDYAIPGIYRCNGLPVTDCDRSNGPYRGTIYINWTDQRNGEEDTDVWLARSTDGGDTWSEAVRVNNDPPGKQQFFTWMTVDQVTGHLWFVFYDRRSYEDHQTDVYLAVSEDGGQTFSNFRVSESPFIPSSGVFFGDYTCITAVGGKVRPIWTRLDEFDLSVYTAIVDTMISSLPGRENAAMAIDHNYPNPFRESTAFAFRIRRTTTISLRVMDIHGKQVATIINNETLIPGKYVRTFLPPPGLPSGVYYFSLSGNGPSEQRKIIYQK